MEDVSPSEALSRFSSSAKDVATQLRVGIFSLPGVEERGYRDPETGSCSIHFAVGGDALVEVHSNDVLRVTMDLSAEDVRGFHGRTDLATLEFEPWGQREVRKHLEEILRDLEEEGQFRLDLAVASQVDLRSFTRLVHAKYDMLISR